jgi:hypothetical protein
MSDTPRTDAVAARFSDEETEHPHALAFSELSRQLERELAEAKTEIGKLKKERDKLKTDLALAYDQIVELRKLGRNDMRQDIRDREEIARTVMAGEQMAKVLDAGEEMKNILDHGTFCPECHCRDCEAIRDWDKAVGKETVKQ